MTKVLFAISLGLSDLQRNANKMCFLKCHYKTAYVVECACLFRIDVVWTLRDEWQNSIWFIVVIVIWLFDGRNFSSGHTCNYVAFSMWIENCREKTYKFTKLLIIGLRWRICKNAKKKCRIALRGSHVCFTTHTQKKRHDRQMQNILNLIFGSSEQGHVQWQPVPLSNCTRHWFLVQ